MATQRFYDGQPGPDIRRELNNFEAILDGTVASAQDASTAATSASVKAQQWADAAPGVEVETGKYSAKHWADRAQTTVTGGLIYRGSHSAASGAYPATPSLGDYYKISAAGTLGGVAYSVGDSIIYNGTNWDKIDSTDAVTSVAGRVGEVVLTKDDVGLGNVDNTSDANKPVSSATQAALNTKAPVSHTHDASAIVSGVIDDYRLPPRLREKPQGITDWNTAVASGWYQGNDAANAPSTGNFIGNVECHHERWVTQVVHLFTADSEEDTKTYRRESYDAGAGVAEWKPWYRLRLSEAEQAAVTQAWWEGTAIPVGKVTGLQTALDTKVDKVAGKQLSTEDYTTAEKTKLAGVAAGAQVNTVTSVAGKTGAVTLAKGDVGLGNVDNTSDANKPISTATQAALNGKQAALGFTPVQQGGPAGYGTNKVYIGWATDGSGLLCQVDATNFHQSWPISITGSAAMVINQSASPAVRQVADIGAIFVNWTVDTVAPAVQLDTPNPNSTYMVWRATRWGGRHVAAMHVYEGNMTVTMSVGNLNNFAWDGNGNFTATGNVNALSDIRLKTDLTKIEGALEKVCAINGYTYTRKDTGARQTGVVAQEVQKVLPEAVIDNGEHLAVAYGNMVGLLIEAIKELKAEVDQLKGK